MPSFYDRLNDPDDRPFFAALLNDSDNPKLRADYAEFLERRGDPSAAAVRAANLLLQGVADSAERARLAAVVAEARSSVDEYLAALLFSPRRVQNCGEERGAAPALRFAFRCPQSWGEMRPTEDEQVRFCERCSMTVQRCDTLADAERHALLGGCISVGSRVMSEVDARYARAVTGRPDVIAMWADRLFAAAK